MLGSRSNVWDDDNRVVAESIGISLVLCHIFHRLNHPELRIRVSIKLIPRYCHLTAGQSQSMAYTYLSKGLGMVDSQSTISTITHTEPKPRLLCHGHPKKHS